MHLAIGTDGLPFFAMSELAVVTAPIPAIRPEVSISVATPLPAAIRSVSLFMFDRAIGSLRAGGRADLDAGIHGARKSMKRLRGLVRLVRDEVGYRPYREENVVLRDTARAIGGIRDARVMVDTLRGLRARHADILDERALASTEQFLVRRHRRQRDSITRAVLSGAIVNLGSARSRFARYPIEEAIRDDFSAIAGGLGRVYRRGRRAFGRAGDSLAVEDLHEWRKRVKYLRYQIEALTPVQPRLLGALAAELHQLGELLGDDHDLAVLAETVIDHPEAVVDRRELWLLAALSQERRHQLQRRALSVGGALYGEPAGAFVDRMGAYWEAGRT